MRRYSTIALALVVAFGVAGASATVAAKGGPKGQGGNPGKNKGWKGNQNPGKGKGAKRGGKHAGKWHGRPGGRITTYEASIIRGYYGGSSPGCRRRLPPGIRKNLARGKPLPPGQRRRYGCALPRRLIAELPPRPGYVYYLMGRDIVLISLSTNRVIDVTLRLF